MSIWLDVTRIATVANLALLAGLSYVWLRNYLHLKTKFTIGFVLFGGFLVAHNGVALYLFALNPTTSNWFVDIPEFYNLAFMVLALLQFAALAVLAWVTME